MIRPAEVLRLPMVAGLTACLVCTLGIWVGQLHADGLTLLPCDAAAAEARFQAVLSAERQLDVACFIIDGDAVSRCFLDLLLDAARRGVRVRIVVDGMHNGIPADVQLALLSCGARIREYHRPQTPLIQSFTRRLHDKLLLKDGTEMIVGSRNVEDAHFGLREAECENYLDLDVEVRGRVVAEASAYFDGLWASGELQEVDPDVLERRMRREQRQPAGWDGPADSECTGRTGSQQHSPAACAEGPILDEAGLEPSCRVCCPQGTTFDVNCGDLCFFCDPCGRKDGGGNARQSVYRILESAQHWIVMETPYFVPSGELGRILEDALCRGVQVCILTNSWETTDYPVIYAGYRNVIGRYERMGADVWEYSGPRTLHAKSLVVDGRVACVTSFNFDPRSAHLDTQVGVAVCDPQVAGCLLGIMRQHFARGRPISIAGRRFPAGELVFANPAEAAGDDCLETARGKLLLNQGGIADAARLSLLRLIAPVVWRQL